MSTQEYLELLNWHDEQLGKYNLGILNGPLYVFKKTSLNTHQFWVSPSWQKGSILVNGQLYHDILLVFDMNNEALVMKHPDHGYPYGVELRNIEGFNLYDHRFVWLDNNSIPNGYYDELYNGHVLGLYVKRTKKERASDLGGTEYSEQEYYFVQLYQELYAFHGIKFIYSLAPDKKTFIRKLKRESGLHPSVNNEKDLIAFIAILEENIFK